MKKLSTRRDLTGSNEVLRKRLAQLLPLMWKDFQFSERISRIKESLVHA
jgi:hypothetical protein